MHTCVLLEGSGRRGWRCGIPTRDSPAEDIVFGSLIFEMWAFFDLDRARGGVEQGFVW
jgi:hypothetical protein